MLAINPSPSRRGRRRSRATAGAPRRRPALTEITARTAASAESAGARSGSAGARPGSAGAPAGSGRFPNSSETWISGKRWSEKTIFQAELLLEINPSPSRRGRRRSRATAGTPEQRPALPEITARTAASAGAATPGPCSTGPVPARRRSPGAWQPRPWPRRSPGGRSGRPQCPGRP